MDSDEIERDKRLLKAEDEEEELDHELTKQQKKAALRELKSQYGKDWKKILLGAARSLKINAETMHTLHGMGVNLKDYNDPRMMRR